MLPLASLGKCGGTGTAGSGQLGCHCKLAVSSPVITGTTLGPSVRLNGNMSLQNIPTRRTSMRRGARLAFVALALCCALSLCVRAEVRLRLVEIFCSICVDRFVPHRHATPPLPLLCHSLTTVFTCQRRHNLIALSSFASHSRFDPHCLCPVAKTVVDHR